MGNRPQDVASEVSFVDVTIASGASLSTVGALGGMHLVGVITGAAWTDAAISFLGKDPAGEAMVPLYDAASGDPVSVVKPGANLSAARWYPLDPRKFIGVNDIQILSGVHGTAVNQAAARTLRLVCRKL